MSAAVSGSPRPKQRAPKIVQLENIAIAAVHSTSAQPRFRRYVVDHTGDGSAVCVAYSPDNHAVLAGFSSGDVCAWSPATEKCRVFKRHYGSVQTMAISPNGTVVSGGGDSMLYRWPAKNENRVQPISGHTQTVRMVRHSHDGKWFASCSDDSTVRLWHTATGNAAATFTKHKDAATCIAFASSGFLASGGKDKTISVVDMGTRKVRLRLKGHTAAVTRVSFNPAGDLLASCADDCSVRVWCPRSGTCYETLDRAHGGVVREVIISSSTLVSAGAGGTLWRMDVQNEAPSGRPIKAHASSISDLVFSPDASVLATVSHDGSMALWDVATLKNICRFLEPGRGHIECCAFSADGTKLATGGKSGKFILWDLLPGASSTGHSGQGGGCVVM